MITTVVGNYPKVPSLSNGPNLRTAIGRFDQGGSPQRSWLRLLTKQLLTPLPSRSKRA